jgi:copper chaperone CopZ
MKKGLLMMIAFFMLNALNAQTTKGKTQKVLIKTSAECGDCKERIESKLNYVKGVVYAELDVETKELTVKFKSDKITLEEIKKIISEIGYDADEVKANPENQAKLPACCQPGGMKK